MVHNVFSVCKNLAYFNQQAWKPSKAMASMVIKHMITTRTGILDGLVPAIIGSMEEQDYSLLSVHYYFACIEKLTDLI